MDHFRILSKSGNEIVLFPGLPEELRQFKLPFAQNTAAFCNFGSISFQQIKGDNWSNWKINYLIQESAEIYSLADLEIIELHMAGRNNF
jgi:hypothetical protein